MIYISSACVKHKKIKDSVHELAENGFKNNPKRRAETDKSRSYKIPSTKDSKSLHFSFNQLLF